MLSRKVKSNKKIFYGYTSSKTLKGKFGDIDEWDRWLWNSRRKLYWVSATFTSLFISEVSQASVINEKLEGWKNY